MSKYQKFTFESYKFDAKSGTLTLNYGYDDALKFTETYRFDFEYADYSQAALDRALQMLFFVAGVSYYKMYLAPKIIVKKGAVDAPTAKFLNKTYQKGLGEFWHVNNLDPHTKVEFPKTADEPLQAINQRPSDGLLVAIGGGKDSLVSIELLRGNHQNITTWSLNHRPQLAPLVDKIGLKHAWVERQWDPQIAKLNQQDALNGHIPISAIFACTGAIVAILTGNRDIVVSNEQSASDPTLRYRGVDINHQYSKSLEFEKDFQELTKRNFGGSVRYYSFLRPLSEVHIAQIFAKVGFQKYQGVFSSCNRAFVHGSDHLFWCGECPKCAFTFLILSPFISPGKLQSLWGGKNLLADPALEPTYRNLLGIEGNKPLDCVGDVKESRTAMRLAFQNYPELKAKYKFEIPKDYDYQALGPHAMPPEMYKLLKADL